MPTRTVIALSISALFYASCAQAAWAREPMSMRGSATHSQPAPCRPPNVGLLSRSSDFVAIPYTFGNTLEYRPAWTAEAQARTGASRKMTKRQMALSPAPGC
jgi:hypothetical protein